MTQKERIEIPAEVAARVLFRSHRTCCVCREPRKPVQIHHIDEDPSNGAEENLAVLCFECHDQTQIKGGFGRKLNAHQVILYRNDWYALVEQSRQVEPPKEDIGFSNARVARIHGRTLSLNYLKLSEKDEEHRYTFEAEYPQIAPEDSSDATEINITLAAFVVGELQRFRAGAIGASEFKRGSMMERLSAEACWDRLAISHAIGAFTSDVLSVDFQFVEYGAGAAHSRHTTRTFNYQLRPARQLEF